MSLRQKIVLIGMSQLVLIVGVLFALYYRDSHATMQQQYVEKARSIILNAESMREEMANKWELGMMTPEQLSGWAQEGRLDKILASVPVVTAWQAAMAKAKEGGYEFKVPKFEPRNPKNEPDELEARALNKFKNEGLAEYFEIDESLNAVRNQVDTRMHAVSRGSCDLCGIVGQRSRARSDGCCDGELEGRLDPWCVRGHLITGRS